MFVVTANEKIVCVCVCEEGMRAPKRETFVTDFVFPLKGETC